MSWWAEGPLLPNLTVFEEEKPLVVILDHTGQPYVRHRAPMGFIDPNNLPYCCKQKEKE